MLINRLPIDAKVNCTMLRCYRCSSVALHVLYSIMQCTFKFGRREHVALRRKVLKLLIARLSMIYLDL